MCIPHYQCLAEDPHHRLNSYRFHLEPCLVYSSDFCKSAVFFYLSACFPPLQSPYFAHRFLYRSTQSGNRIQLASCVGHFTYCFVAFAHTTGGLSIFFVDFERIVDLALICLSFPLTCFLLGTQNKARHLLSICFLCKPGWVKDRVGLHWVGEKRQNRREPNLFFSLFIHAGEATSTKTKTQQTNSQVAMLCHTRGGKKGKREALTDSLLALVLKTLFHQSFMA